MADKMRIILATTVIAVAAIASQAAAAPGGERPFRATISGVAVPAQEARCGADLALSLTMKGNAGHMGALSALGTHCTLWSLTQAAVPFYSGLATFRAADGSTLEIRYGGWQDAPVGPIASLSVTAEVVSGTGRFIGAEGTWAGSGVIDFTTFRLDATLGGWISY